VPPDKIKEAFEAFQSAGLSEISFLKSGFDYTNIFRCDGDFFLENGFQYQYEDYDCNPQFCLEKGRAISNTAFDCLFVGTTKIYSPANVEADRNRSG
jgi:hypothetical protein